MIVATDNFETGRDNQAVAVVACLQDAAPRRRQIEASEFERLLQRAMEVLSLRERSALMERSRLTAEADAAAAIAVAS